MLAQTVAITMRIIHNMVQNYECQKETVNLKGTKKQFLAAIVLYENIIKEQGLPPMDSGLLPSLHSFLTTLLQSGDLSSEVIACPTDQAIFLLSIRPSGLYSKANTVASNCAAFRYGFHGIFVHVIREKFLGLTTFQFFEPPTASSNDLRQQNTIPDDDENGNKADKEEESEDEDEDNEESEDEDEDNEESEDENDEEDTEKLLEQIMKRTNFGKSLP